MSPVEDTRYTEAKRDAWLADARRDAQRAGRWEYYKPLAILLIGFVISVGILMSRMDSGLLGSLVSSSLIAGVFLAISVPVGMLAMLLTCQIFGSEAGPLGLVLIRLGAVYSITMIIGLLLPGCFNILVSGLIMAGMVAILFDMELAEGAVFTLASLFIFIGAGIMLRSVL